ncbi:MAG: hypothetical protein EHM41_07870 [Chloroflexi bacterium]|nr:MAG: hypothetical protein EHM41_07870 [Chloroflexota bacterium]
MAKYKVGDTVVHWIYGSGNIVAIEDKGLPGEPCNYYIINGSKQILWVPVDETAGSSLHLPISASDFSLLIKILRSSGEEMSNNPFIRSGQLDKQMQLPTPKDLCLVIRDLTYRAHSRKLSSSDMQILAQAQSYLLDEWERSLGTPREEARHDMEWMLREAPARHHSFYSHRLHS